MRISVLIASVLLAATSTTIALGQASFPGANAKAVMSSAKRKDALAAAARMLAPRDRTWKATIVGLPDPFFRTASADSGDSAGRADDQASRRVQRSDLEILKAVAPEIRPQGTLLIGAEPFLLMGGKRFKVGDQLSVTFEDRVYRVTISAIERNSYTLRLNEQELQREFK